MINRKALTALLIFLIPLILAIVFLALFSEEVPAQSHPIDLEKLRGLESVSVVISFEREGSSESLSRAIRNDVELELRRSGITVDATASSFLVVSIVANEGQIWVVHTGTELWQHVALVRDPSVTFGAITWSAVGRLNTFSTKNQFLLGIQRVAIDLVKEFCNAYLVANSRKEE